MKQFPAKHAIVGPKCVEAHGSIEAAVDEALRRLREEALICFEGHGFHSAVAYHFKLEIELGEGEK